MKLTKGRLSKLYRKTNQSKRRIKKNKKRPVLRNTFRKRRPFDLNRKTLKRLRGGPKIADYDAVSLFPSAMGELDEGKKKAMKLMLASGYGKPWGNQ